MTSGIDFLFGDKYCKIREMVYGLAFELSCQG